MVAKVAYATLATDLTAVAAAVDPADDFYAVACLDRTAAYQQALAAWALSNNRLAIVQSGDVSGVEIGVMQTAVNDRCAALYHLVTEYADMAWGAMGLSADPDVTASVWYDKTLSGITVSPITAAQKATLLGKGANLVLPLMGVSATGPGKLTNGDWIDERISADWLKARIQEAIAQLKLDMSNRNTKIPYTAVGLAMIEAVIRGVTDKGERIGHFVPGATVIATPDMADVSTSDITARTATIPVTVTLSGGISTVTVNVGVLAA
jgi:hypothetical protein